MGQLKRRSRRPAESGVSLVEVMIAAVVMIVGVLGVMMLITGSIAANTRNKMDSTATMAAQQVLEIVQTFSANSIGTFSGTDCLGNTFTIAVAGATGNGAGAPLNAVGAINFTQAQVTNYSLNWPVCTTGGRTATYDVRWNVRTLTPGTALVTVAARKRGSSDDLRYYAIPVSLRTIVGP